MNIYMLVNNTSQWLLCVTETDSSSLSVMNWDQRKSSRSEHSHRIWSIFAICGKSVVIYYKFVAEFRRQTYTFVYVFLENTNLKSRNSNTEWPLRKCYALRTFSKVLIFNNASRFRRSLHLIRMQCSFFSLQEFRSWKKDSTPDCVSCK